MKNTEPSLFTPMVTEYQQQIPSSMCQSILRNQTKCYKCLATSFPLLHKQKNIKTYPLHTQTKTMTQSKINKRKKNHYTDWGIQLRQSRIGKSQRSVSLAWQIESYNIFVTKAHVSVNKFKAPSHCTTTVEPFINVLYSMHAVIQHASFCLSHVLIPLLSKKVHGTCKRLPRRLFNSVRG